MFPRLALDQFAKPEPLRTLAALFCEQIQLLVEAVGDLLLEVIDMAPLAPVKLGRLHRHAVGLIGFFVGPSAVQPIMPLSQSKLRGFSPFFVMGGN